MTNFRIVNDIIYYQIWQLGGHIYQNDNIVQEIQQECNTNQIELISLKNYTWILDCGPEGISPKEVEPIFYYLVSLGVPATNFKVIYSCVVDTDSLPYPAITFTNRMIQHVDWWTHQLKKNIDWQNITLTHDFVCMMRRASIDRAHLCELLLQTFSRSSMILTFGSATNDLAQYSAGIADIVKSEQVPIRVENTPCSNEQCHLLDTNIFYQAPINLIVETSSQIDPGWTSIFITEKTYKAFTWYQFPIWYAVPRLVKEVRNQGFDVFDDLFQNHYYDDIEDPVVRRQEVVQLLNRVLNNNVADLKKQHWNRLCANVDVYKKHQQNDTLNLKNSIDLFKDISPIS